MRRRRDYVYKLFQDTTHAISIGIIGLYLGTVIGIQDELFFYTYFPLLTFLLVIINTPLSPKDGMVTAAILFVLFIIGTVLPFNDTFRGWMKPEIYHLNEKKENHNFVVMGRTKGFILILAIVFTYLVIIYYY